MKKGAVDLNLTVNLLKTPKDIMDSKILHVIYIENQETLSSSLGDMAEETPAAIKSISDIAFIIIETLWLFYSVGYHFDSIRLRI